MLFRLLEVLHLPSSIERNQRRLQKRWNTKDHIWTAIWYYCLSGDNYKEAWEELKTLRQIWKNL